MQFKVSDLSVLLMGTNQNIKETYDYLTPGYSEVITDSSVVRDLRVHISSEGSYFIQTTKFYSYAS